jgi:hypothetical protein
VYHCQLCSKTDRAARRRGRVGSNQNLVDHWLKAPIKPWEMRIKPTSYLFCKHL